MIDLKKRRAEFAKVRDQRKAELIKRDGMACHYCDCVLVDIHAQSLPIGVGKLVIDHVVPVFHGGGDDLDNLVLACVECNSRKRDKPYERRKNKSKIFIDRPMITRMKMSFVIRMRAYFNRCNPDNTEPVEGDKLDPKFVSGMLKGFKR